jgi:hypothetical protein
MRGKTRGKQQPRQTTSSREGNAMMKISARQSTRAAMPCTRMGW